MVSDGIIEINRCDDILFHRNISLIHKPFHPWNSSEHETGDFSGLAQFYFLLLIYQPNQLRTIHLSIIELEFKIVWLSKIFTVWNPLRKAPRRPFDAPVLILCPTDESRKWSESYSLWSLKNFQTVRSINHYPAMSPFRHRPELDVWSLWRLSFNKHDIPFLEICDISAVVARRQQQHW